MCYDLSFVNDHCLCVYRRWEEEAPSCRCSAPSWVHTHLRTATILWVPGGGECEEEEQRGWRLWATDHLSVPQSHKPITARGGGTPPKGHHTLLLPRWGQLGPTYRVPQVNTHTHNTANIPMQKHKHANTSIHIVVVSINLAFILQWDVLIRPDWDRWQQEKWLLQKTAGVLISNADNQSFSFSNTDIVTVHSVLGHYSVCGMS